MREAMPEDRGTYAYVRVQSLVMLVYETRGPRSNQVCYHRLSSTSGILNKAT